MTENQESKAKFKIGDYIKYQGKTWKIDGFCLANGEDAYDLSTPSGKGLHIISVLIPIGNEYFSKA